ncbi:Tellurium resistance protein TerD [marine bacterium AO1-C]|nr:Tellurium resistance protein TerD [marine bacterium AO1-C]
MSISLNKKTGINLKKGSSISLEKQGKILEEVCFGLNWGAIQKKALFGLISAPQAVDLDGGVMMFDSANRKLDTVYFDKLISNDRAIVHSGDDLEGDVGADDGHDNEVIEINLHKVAPDVQQIVFYLHSYKGQDFASIPFSKIRIFEGNKNRVDDVLATLNLSADEAFAQKVTMILGKLVRTTNNWKFVAIGEPIDTHSLREAVTIIQDQYL